MRLRPISTLCALAAALGFWVLACGRSDGSPKQAPSAEPRSPVPSAAPAAPVDPMVAQGARAYQHYCQLCHGKDATGYAADNAPSLVSRTFLESASDEFIAAGIRMGRPGTAMAAYGKERGGPLAEQEIAAIVRFLRSKGPGAKPLSPAHPGSAQRGSELYAKNCQSCHASLTVRGTAPDLHNPEFLNAASPAFLRHAIVHGRPPTKMEPFQGKLSEQEIDDVVTWLWGFKPAAPTPPVAHPTIPEDLPIVINPKGAAPHFTLREGRFVPVEQVKKALDAKRKLVIIDARAPSDWIQFHIPGAISLPYHDQSHLERIPRDGTWVVAYCACPHHASGEVVDALRALKYPNTAVMDEGILFWRDKGYPLVGEAVKPVRPSGKPPATTHSKAAKAAPSARQ